jgi:hypothetical protein
VANAVLRKASLGLHSWRICHPTAPWTTLTIPGNRCVDQPGIALRQSFVIEVKESERPCAKILNHDICGIAKLQHQIMGARHVEVDADVALAGVLLRVVTGHAIGRWKRKTGNVGTRRLYLDHFRAQILQGTCA